MEQQLLSISGPKQADG